MGKKWAAANWRFGASGGDSTLDRETKLTKNHEQFDNEIFFAIYIDLIRT